MTTTQSRNYPFSEPHRLNLDPFYAELRDQEPVSRVQLPYGEPAWLVTRYADAKLVLADPRFSRAQAVGEKEPRMSPKISPGGILSMDPPDHTRLRRLVAKAFTSRRVETMRVATQRIADQLAEDMLAMGSPVDLVQHFALPLPITVICDMLGVPYEDHGDFRKWSDAFLSTTALTVEEVEHRRTAMYTYMEKLIAQRREVPADDLITALVSARDDGDRLSEDELVRMCMGILIAGHETTATHIPNFMYTVLTSPQVRESLTADLDQVPTVVEEFLRYIPLGVGSVFPRYATEDVELGGVTVRAGEPVVVSISSANHDPEVFDSPSDLDFARESNAHIGFGHGPHHCLGAQLARMELQVALRTLLERFPGARLAIPEAEVPWKRGMLVRGPSAFPLAWDVDDAAGVGPRPNVE